MVFAAAAAVAQGCAGLTVHEKLARVGLELVSEAEARIPPGGLGTLVPCRTIAGAAEPALPPDPAGYLLVRVARNPPEESTGAAAILRALESWRPGEVLTLRVRRNPYTLEAAEWWEADVKLTLP